MHGSVYTVFQKKEVTKLMVVTPSNLDDFHNSFTDSDRFSGKFAVKWLLKSSPHLKCIATLPCEISVFKKSPC